MPTVIAVHSYRGGTGKSNFTANLATVVAQQGYRVGVVDTDLPSPGIHTILGLEPDQLETSLNHFLWGEATIEAAAQDVSAAAALGDSGRLYLVPASPRADDIARILRHGYEVRLLTEGLRGLVRALQLDYLFIDTHPGLSKATFLSIAVAHVLMLLLRPDKQDYQGTAVTLDVARQLNVPRTLLAINKVYPGLDPQALRQRVEATYGEAVAGVVPLTTEVVQLASEGVFCVRHPDHPVSHEFRQIAQCLIGS
jgi:MinD-like ATPase involved in chromosome partitioning or flagellar assembly